jgi:hypothetical protein
MKTDSLNSIYKGFQRLSDADRAEYLKYFARVIERTQNLAEKNKLSRFKSKLEKVNGCQKSEV